MGICKTVKVGKKSLQIMKTIDCRIKFHEKKKIDNPVLSSLFSLVAQNRQGYYALQFVVQGHVSVDVDAGCIRVIG